MRVVQLSDLHLGPEDHPEAGMRRANRVAWDHARAVAARLGGWPEADRLVVVITGDLTDTGYVNPAEFGPAREWLGTLPGTVRVVPGNHDVGNFASSWARPGVSMELVEQWRGEVGPDWWSHAADGHRLIGLDSMLIGSGLLAEANQRQWLEAELAEAEGEGEKVWVFQHAPLFLREPGEVRSAREHYWCPAAPARDRMLALLDRRCVAGLAHGHVHRRRDAKVNGMLWRSCPALSGTHSEADYFVAEPGVVETHALPTWELTGGRKGGRVEVGWEASGVETTTRYVS